MGIAVGFTNCPLCPAWVGRNTPSKITYSFLRDHMVLQPTATPSVPPKTVAVTIWKETLTVEGVRTAGCRVPGVPVTQEPEVGGSVEARNRS